MPTAHGFDEMYNTTLWTTDNGAWQDVYPDCGYTPYRGTKGTDYEGGSRVPAIAWWPGTIAPGRRNADIVGSLDFMATFANLAGVDLPAEDREGQPTTFDIFMTNLAEKTWQAPQMAARLLSLLPTYRQYPDRPLQTAGISYAMFDVQDAPVQQQIQKMLHGLSTG